MAFKQNLTVNALIIGALLAGIGDCVFAAEPDAAAIRAAATPVLTRRGAHVVETQKAAVFVNGVAVDFGGTALLSQSGRLFVPLRAISEAAGALVSYDAATRTVTI